MTTGPISGNHVDMVNKDHTDMKAKATLTSDPHSPSNSQSQGTLKPEWIRPREVGTIFGLGRGAIDYLINTGKVRTINLVQPGLNRGTRLLCYASVSEYLEKLATEQAQARAQQKEAQQEEGCLLYTSPSPRDS